MHTNGLTSRASILGLCVESAQGLDNERLGGIKQGGQVAELGMLLGPFVGSWCLNRALRKQASEKMKGLLLTVKVPFPWMGASLNRPTEPPL